MEFGVRFQALNRVYSRRRLKIFYVNPLAKKVKNWYKNNMTEILGMTIERLKEVLEYNPSEGTFVWKERVSARQLRGNNALSHLNGDGYWVIGLNRKQILAQKIAYIIMTGEFPNGMISFKDKDRKNIKWDNLFVMKKIIGEFDHSTPESRKLYHKAYRDQNPGKTRNDHLKNTFGIDSKEYERMFKEQNGRCACCDEPETAFLKGKLLSLAVDHDHATGEIRQLLCRGCNVGLGSFKDNKNLLLKAASYLEKHKSTASNVIKLKGAK